jgi:hypothetical protein
MDDLLSQIEEELTVAAEAHQRITETDSYQGIIRAHARQAHFMYQPPGGDQWPEDAVQRPGKIHVSVNIIKPAVNIDARLQAIPPRVVLVPDGLSEERRVRAESAEKLHLSWLEASGWDVWLEDLCRTRALYRKGVLKVHWNKDDKRPDVVVLENPTNLRIGWGSSDFRVMDWALYEYEISPQEAMIRYDIKRIYPSDDKKHLLIDQGTDHLDPLNQATPLGQTRDTSRPVSYMPSDYEQKHVKVWDYWYKKPDGKGGFTVCNAALIEGQLVRPHGAKSKIAHHKYMPDIPYIVIENDHEPGSPEGMSYVEDLIDLQIEFNRALSHWMQLIADNIDPAWQLTGENADSIPPGMVPKANEVVAAGSKNRIEAIDKPINQFPVESLLAAIWNAYHKITGLSEILFGQLSGAQVSGRATAIQIEGAANRLDPRRKRLYAGLKELLVFWTMMAERVNPKIEVGTDEETGEVIRAGIGEMVKGFRRWKLIAPEITPRDVAENVSNEINKVQARLSSRRTAMDQIGTDSPEDEVRLVKQELMDAQLNPESAHAYLGLVSSMQQLQMQMEQQMQMAQQMQAANPQQGLQEGQAGLNEMQQQQFAAQPTMVGEDQNQPMTQEGSPAPPGGQGPVGISQQTLIRGGEVLDQLALRREL